jgi:hypothetical protein
MTRVPDYFRESTIKDKNVGAIWRGIGFIILVGLTIGAFWLAGYLLELNWAQPFLPFRVPRNFSIVITQLKWLPPIPGKPVVQIGAAILIDVIAYAVMVVLYALVFPIRPGPTDAKQPRGTGRRSMRR